jgi:hypothetical protein
MLVFLDFNNAVVSKTGQHDNFFQSYPQNDAIQLASEWMKAIFKDSDKYGPFVVEFKRRAMAKFKKLVEDFPEDTPFLPMNVTNLLFDLFSHYSEALNFIKEFEFRVDMGIKDPGVSHSSKAVPSVGKSGKGDYSKGHAASKSSNPSAASHPNPSATREKGPKKEPVKGICWGCGNSGHGLSQCFLDKVEATKSAYKFETTKPPMALPANFVPIVRPKADASDARASFSSSSSKPDGSKTNHAGKCVFDQSFCSL